MDAVEVAAQVAGFAGIDDEQLQAPRAGDLLERRRGGIHRADGELATAAYGFTQLQQEIVPRGDGDDFGRSPRGRLRAR